MFENNNKKIIKKPIKSSQIGAIVFVDEKSTSQTCPYCERIQHRKETKADEKFRQHRFICEDKNQKSCGFDTYAFISELKKVKDYLPKVKQDSYDEKFQFLKGIDDPDKVAAYNIAKKITDPKNIGRWELPKAQSQKDQNKAHSERHQTL